MRTKPTAAYLDNNNRDGGIILQYAWSEMIEMIMSQSETWRSFIVPADAHTLKDM